MEEPYERMELSDIDEPPRKAVAAKARKAAVVDPELVVIGDDDEEEAAMVVEEGAREGDPVTADERRRDVPIRKGTNMLVLLFVYVCVCC